MLFKSKTKPTFSISIARDALEAVFDECDRFEVDETGGRLLGTFRHENGHYEIAVKGILEPGPKAERSPTYFMQDGEYQERLFRAIEASYPDIEHLGNWHTHHVNGYPTLSSGDKTTYFKTVNHEKHNIDFFYALLVVSKNRGANPRYTVKHFIFRRDDDTIYEISAKDVRLVDIPALRPESQSPIETNAPQRPDVPQVAANPERGKDREFFAEFYPNLKPLLSKSSGAPYWKGAVPLVDGSQADIVAVEDDEGDEPFYSIATSCKNPVVIDLLPQLRELKFRSARHAVLHLEHTVNQALYDTKKETAS